MNQNPVRVQLSWLHESRPDLEDEYTQGPVAIPIPAELGHGEFTRIDLPLGFSFFTANHHFLPAAAGRLVPVAEVSIDYGEPRFIVQSLRKGRVCQQELDPDITLMFEPGRDLFAHAVSRRCRPMVEGTTTCEMVAMSLSIQWLHALIGEQEGNRLLGFLGIGPLQSFSVRAFPRRLSALLFDAISPRISGPVLWLAAQAKALDYLSQLLDCCDIPYTPEGTRSSIQGKVTRLRSHLLSLEGKLPSLEALSKEYGMSARRLNAEFLRVYGEPILGFITGHRLEQARLALLETDIPMKALSARLGFSHVNYFITVFKRRFGYTPGSIRKVG